MTGGLLREHLAGRRIGAKSGFRWRGEQVSRIEGFSDAGFAFALTLLVVSLEVPRTFADLAETMRGFWSFAFCFAALALVWFEHYTFFRRYGLEDTWTILLNLVLLFVVLFYVYPLKFLFTLLVRGLLGVGTGADLTEFHWRDGTKLMVIYGAGYIAVYAVFVLLYLRAFALRAQLELDRLEAFDTINKLISHGLCLGVGVVSVLVAVAWSATAAGWTYMAIPVSQFANGWVMGSRRKKLEDLLVAEAGAVAAP